MSFAEHEESRTLANPDSLYRFTVGDLTYGYTDCEEAIVHGGVTYVPIPVDMDPVTASGTLDKSQMKIRVPHDAPIAELFKVFPPSEVVAVTVFQRHDEDMDGQVLARWVGRVLSCSREGSEATLSCEPVNTSMRRVGLRMRDQYSCMHALYGAACGVNRAAFTVSTVVASISGSFVTFANGWNGAIAEAAFTNGILMYDVDAGSMQLQILSVDAANNRLRIGGVLTGLEAGATVSLSRGCSHNMGAGGCADFANVQNFGGAPFIPKKNPLASVSQFY